MDLVLVNRSRKSHPALTAAVVENLLCWETCLRQVYFLSPEQFANSNLQRALSETDEVFKNADAYQFLLQVLAGLRSPLIGETEVLGQFKNFLQKFEANPLIQKERSMWNMILRDCKQVREQHLRGLGSQSYGSLCRKLAKGSENVLLIGAGQLAEQILPWLKKTKSVQIQSRSEAKALRFRDLRSDLQWQAFPAPTAAEVLVICAPILNSDLQNLIDQSNLRLIIDLRGEQRAESQNLVVPEACRRVDLEEFMSNINLDRQSMQDKLTQAQVMIKDMSETHFRKILVRPMGWDDLCA